MTDGLAATSVMKYRKMGGAIGQKGEPMDDLISREYMKSLGATCIASRSKDGTLFPIVAIDELPPADPTHEAPSNTLGALDCVERKNVKVFPVDPISYLDCSNAMLKMWMDNVVTDGEYNRIMDKLNKKHEEDMRGENE